MKRLLPFLLLLLAPQAYSCVSAGQNVVCIGDHVYKGNSYSQGAVVVSEDRFSQNVTVRSNSTGNLFVENVQSLDITYGCLSSLCVQDTVYKGNSYSQGARVIGINFYTGSVTIQSIATAGLFVELPENLESNQGCLGSICVGDKVYKGAEYSQGAIVQSINLSRGYATIRSVATGGLFSHDLQDLDITRGCVANFCVGDRVYKGSEYSQGARILALNSQKYSATIQSVATSKLYSESLYNLQNTPHDPGPIPPTPPGPRPPRPPRPPEPPAPPTPPGRITVQCTVGRLDPSGLLVMSYTDSATGFPGQDLKGEACNKATRACELDLRGRQTCRITR